MSKTRKTNSTNPVHVKLTPDNFGFIETPGGVLDGLLPVDPDSSEAVTQAIAGLKDLIRRNTVQTRETETTTRLTQALRKCFPDGVYPKPIEVRKALSDAYKREGWGAIPHRNVISRAMKNLHL